MDEINNDTINREQNDEIKNLKNDIIMLSEILENMKEIPNINDMKIRERNEELKKINEQMEKLYELFKETHNIINEDEQKLDNIETKTEVIIENVNLNYKHATEYENNKKTKYIILGLGTATAIIASPCIALLCGTYYGIASGALLGFSTLICSKIVPAKINNNYYNKLKSS